MNAAAVSRTRTSASTMNRKVAWLILFLLVADALAISAIPVWIIQPFKSQMARGLLVAYTLKRWSPLITAVGLIIVLALAIFLWRGARRWWLKVALVILIAFTFGSAWFARQNHFEWMFNPLPNVSFAKTSDASFVANSDQVLAVQINGEAAAYPILQIAYHHVIQDEVGGTPIVATY
jgi:hypothetical protein